MKDYIYIDTELLNSYLAQSFEGLPIKATNEETSLNSNTESESSTFRGDVRVLPAGIGTVFGGDIESSEASGLTEGQKEVLESAFHDYAVDLLIDSLSDSGNLTTSSKDIHVGDIIQITDTFTVLDFEYISNVTNLGSFEKFLNPNRDEIIEIEKQINLLRKVKSKQFDKKISSLEKKRDEILKSDELEAVSVFNMIHDFSSFAEKLFPNTIILKTSNLLLLLDKHFLRNTISQINILANSKRKITVLGTSISSIDSIWDGNKTIDDFKPEQIGSIPSMLSNIVLSSFHLIKVDDLYIKPIAIYFE